MKRSHHHQISAVFFALAALATGCSPITASISKQAGAPLLSSSGTSARSHVLAFSTRVVEHDGESEKSALVPASSRSLTVNLSSAQLEAFRESGKAELEFSGSVTPDGIVAIFEVSMAQSEIRDAGLVDQPVATLQAKGENGWELRLSQSLTADQVEHLLSQLAQVRLEITQE